MGSLILCHADKAKQPYEISRVHMKIYTIEELCYYIYHHLYLIDHTLVNRPLCDWLSDELQLSELSDDLRELLNQNCTVDQFVLKLLKDSNIYNAQEIHKINDMLEDFRNQKEVEREKFKADTLLKNGECEAAILIYQTIVNKEWDETVERSFYGKIYACLGSAYGKLFLYDQAAAMYEQAYRYYHEEEILKPYLFCCYMSYPAEEYVKMLSGNALYLSVDAKIKEDLKQMQERVITENEEVQIDKWKTEYRNMNKI